MSTYSGAIDGGPGAGLGAPASGGAPAGFHFSVDDVFTSLIELSERRLAPDKQPFLAFCRDLVDIGAIVDLYLFRQARQPDGKVWKLDAVSDEAAATLSHLEGIRFGPHAEDYATPPHIQSLDDQTGTMQGLFAEIARLSTPRQRARWLRLHYFSECFELASLWHGHGVDALLTTDKPALSHRMGAAAIAALQDRGHVDFGGMTMIRSHLRIETFAEEAADPPRFLDRIDAFLDAHGFVSLFTHENEIADPRVRALATASVRHLTRRGVQPI